MLLLNIFYRIVGRFYWHGLFSFNCLMIITTRKKILRTSSSFDLETICSFYQEHIEPLISGWRKYLRKKSFLHLKPFSSIVATKLHIFYKPPPSIQGKLFKVNEIFLMFQYLYFSSDSWRLRLVFFLNFSNSMDVNTK